MGNKSVEETAFDLMKEAFEELKNATPSRENSIVITNLEQAMMWCNKDRSIKGQLAKSETHVE